jgi:hypothetical protein
MSPYLQTLTQHLEIKSHFIGNLEACREQGECASDQGYKRFQNPYPNYAAESKWWDYGWTHSLTELCGEK